ncbi:MAG: 5-formyltetrahydrofolate cyclo-ligase [Planctomycetota bacterium]
MPTKDYFRDQVAACIRGMAPRERAALDARLSARLAALPELAAAGTALWFHPLPDEPDLRPLMRAWMAGGRVLCLPAIDAGSGRIVPRALADLDAGLIPGRYGIPAPGPGCPAVPVTEITVVITPGRAFDPSGRRIGRGAGYYDRFLPTVRAVTIAPAYACQVFPAVPAGPADIPVDILVTEDGVIDCRTAERKR